MKEWYLKTNKEIFGPVTRDTLIDWARKGRIQPGQYVSKDGNNWYLATEIDFLEMRWSIDIGDGSLHGPYNKEAAEMLLASGRLPPASRLIEMMPPTVATETDNTAPTVTDDSKDSQIAELQEQVASLQNGLKDAQAAEKEAQEAETRLMTAEKEVQEQKKLQERTLNSLEVTKAQNAEYQQRVIELSQKLEQVPSSAKITAESQAAIYNIMRQEADDLTEMLEKEEKEMENYNQLYHQRRERMLKRRQEILSRIGLCPNDLTKNALRVNFADPRFIQMRQELETLRVLQERTAQEAENKVRELMDRLNVREADVQRLQAKTEDLATANNQIQELREQLKFAELKLFEERRSNEAIIQRYKQEIQNYIVRLSRLEYQNRALPQKSQLQGVQQPLLSAARANNPLPQSHSPQPHPQQPQTVNNGQQATALPQNVQKPHSVTVPQPPPQHTPPPSVPATPQKPQPPQPPPQPPPPPPEADKPQQPPHHVREMKMPSWFALK